jgi:outer membrane immunogenic protein
MKKLVVAGIAAAALYSAPALAADYPTKGGPAPVALFNWSGWYVGVNGGYGKQTDPVLFTDTGTQILNKPKGGMWGGQVGVNQQFGSFVVGLQGDLDATGFSDQNICPNPALTCVSKAKWISSVTGRAGMAFDHFLLYGKFGAAWLRDNFHTTVNSEAATWTTNGITYGGGAEWAFWDRLSLFVEYDHYDFHRASLEDFTPAGVGVEHISVKSKDDVVKGGINYRFGM